jgi:hypothetical protein
MVKNFYHGTQGRRKTEEGRMKREEFTTEHTEHTESGCGKRG